MTLQTVREREHNNLTDNTTCYYIDHCRKRAQQADKQYNVNFTQN